MKYDLQWYFFDAVSYKKNNTLVRDTEIFCHHCVDAFAVSPLDQWNVIAAVSWFEMIL